MRSSSFVSRVQPTRTTRWRRRARSRPRVEPVADRLLIYTDDGDRTKAEINGDGIGASSVLVRRASLEDVFLILTGRTLED